MPKDIVIVQNAQNKKHLQVLLCQEFIKTLLNNSKNFFLQVHEKGLNVNTSETEIKSQ